MSDGTIIKIYKKRLHKCNARDELDDAEHMITYCRDRLMCLAATGPYNVDDGEGPVPWDFYVRREIDGLLETLEEAVVTRLLAQVVVDSPEDCQDELVPEDWRRDDGEEEEV